MKKRTKNDLSQFNTDVDNALLKVARVYRRETKKIAKKYFHCNGKPLKDFMPNLFPNKVGRRLFLLSNNPRLNYVVQRRVKNNYSRIKVALRAINYTYKKYLNNRTTSENKDQALKQTHRWLRQKETRRPFAGKRPWNIIKTAIKNTRRFPFAKVAADCMFLFGYDSHTCEILRSRLINRRQL
jgi:hypothetical protein